MGRIWACAGRTPRKNKKLQKSVKKVTKWLQFGNKKLCENFNNVHNLFTKNLQKIHNFCRGAQKIAFSGKKFVEFDDKVLLDNFSKLWYNGSLAAGRPLGRRSTSYSGFSPGRPFKVFLKNYLTTAQKGGIL